MKTYLIMALTLSMMIFIVPSCSEDEDSDEALISSTNGNKSHNEGQNCMNCHSSGGKGEGRFAAAGTTYKSSGQTVYPNAVVTLSTGANGTGTVRATIYCDAKGNFFTSEAIDFSGGLYAGVKNTSSVVTYMQSPVTQGACNSCHGSSNRIIVQ